MFKSRKQAITAGAVIILCAILLLFLLLKKIDTNSIPLILEEDPIAHYAEAASKLSSNRSLGLMVSEHELLQTGKNIFHTSIQQDIS